MKTYYTCAPVSPMTLLLHTHHAWWFLSLLYPVGLGRALTAERNLARGLPPYPEVMGVRINPIFICIGEQQINSSAQPLGLATQVRPRLPTSSHWTMEGTTPRKNGFYCRPGMSLRNRLHKLHQQCPKRLGVCTLSGLYNPSHKPIQMSQQVVSAENIFSGQNLLGLASNSCSACFQLCAF